MVEKRKWKRRHIIYYLKCYYKDTDELVGQLVDITTSGLKLVTENSVEPGRIIDLRMVLPEEIDNKKEIFFTVRSLWCKRDINPKYFSIGCEFEDISREDMNIIETLIYEYAFRD